MKVLCLLLGILGLFGSTYACDYSFNGIEADGVEGQPKDNFFMVQKILDREGRERILKRVGVPLTAEVKRVFLEASESGAAVCAHGSSSPVSPRVFFIYQAELR